MFIELSVYSPTSPHYGHGQDPISPSRRGEVEDKRNKETREERRKKGGEEKGKERRRVEERKREGGEERNGKEEWKGGERKGKVVVRKG